LPPRPRTLPPGCANGIKRDIHAGESDETKTASNSGAVFVSAYCEAVIATRRPYLVFMPLSASARGGLVIDATPTGRLGSCDKEFEQLFSLSRPRTATRQPILTQ
jgi:hypothetical protein